jgi:hypothetical protein
MKEILEFQRIEVIDGEMAVYKDTKTVMALSLLIERLCDRVQHDCHIM